MIIAYFVLLVIPVSFLCGGRLKYISDNPMRLIWLPPVAFGVEAALALFEKSIPLPVSQWLWIAIIFEYGLIFLFCLLNWNRKPVRLIALGAFLNFFVIAWYGFRMPVAPIAREFPEMASMVERIESGALIEYVMADKGSPFLFLGDSLVLPFLHGGLASIGDLLLGSGVSWLIFQWMRPLPKGKDRPSERQRTAY